MSRDGWIDKAHKDSFKSHLQQECFKLLSSENHIGHKYECSNVRSSTTSFEN